MRDGVFFSLTMEFNRGQFFGKQNKKNPHIFMYGFPGRGTKTRTQDTWFWRPLLYQLSYTPS